MKRHRLAYFRNNMSDNDLDLGRGKFPFICAFSEDEWWSGSPSEWRQTGCQILRILLLYAREFLSNNLEDFLCTDSLVLTVLSIFLRYRSP
jgi:hypothetical protein